MLSEASTDALVATRTTKERPQASKSCSPLVSLPRVGMLTPSSVAHMETMGKTSRLLIAHRKFSDSMAVHTSVMPKLRRYDQADRRVGTKEKDRLYLTPAFV